MGLIRKVQCYLEVKTRVISTPELADLVAWLTENCGYRAEDWDVSLGTGQSSGMDTGWVMRIWFKDANKAMQFKLVWG